MSSTVGRKKRGGGASIVKSSDFGTPEEDQSFICRHVRRHRHGGPDGTDDAHGQTGRQPVGSDTEKGAAGVCGSSCY